MTARQRIGRIKSLILINEFNNILAELVYIYGGVKGENDK